MHSAVGQLVFLGLIQGRRAAKMAFATVRLWLGSNHSSIERVIFFSTYENQDYEIYKDLMSTVFSLIIGIFTPYETEQPLQGMELQETQKD